MVQLFFYKFLALLLCKRKFLFCLYMCQKFVKNSCRELFTKKILEETLNSVSSKNSRRKRDVSEQLRARFRRDEKLDLPCVKKRKSMLSVFFLFLCCTSPATTNQRRLDRPKLSRAGG